MRITKSNLFNNYLLHPLSQDLSKKQNIACLVTSVVLGIFSFGMIHLMSYYGFFKNRTVKNQTKKPTHQDQVIKELSNHLSQQNKSKSINQTLQKEFTKTKTHIADLKLSQVDQIQLKEVLYQIQKNTASLIQSSHDQETIVGIVKGSLHDLHSLVNISKALTTKNTKAAKKELSYLKWKEKIKEVFQKGRTNCTESILKEFKHLLEHEEFLNKNNFNPMGKGTLFHELAKWGKPIEFLELLINKNVDFNAQDTWKNTPLIWAIANAQNEMAMEIVKLGKDHHQNLDVQGLHGNCALHLTIGKGYKKLSKDGEVLKFTNFELTKKLLEFGANPNILNKDGNTPLHLAFIRHDYETISLLLKFGADPKIQNHQGKKPIDMLPNSYSQALQEIKATVFAALINRDEFLNNLQKIQYEFGNL